MIWHGIYKQLIQIFIENIGHQLFLPILMDTKGIGFSLEAFPGFFSEAHHPFSPPGYTSVPGREHRSIQIHIHNIGRI